MQAPFAIRKTVVESNFFAGSNFSPSNNPDTPTNGLGPTIWRTRVIDQAGDVTGRSAVEIVLFIEIENIDAVIASASLALLALFLALPCLRFRDAFARIFNHPCAIRDNALRIYTAAVNRRLARTNPIKADANGIFSFFG